MKSESMEGEVVKLNILEGTVTIKTDDGQEVVVRGEDIKQENTSDRPKKPLKSHDESKPKKTHKGHPAPVSSLSLNDPDESDDNSEQKKENP